MSETFRAKLERTISLPRTLDDNDITTEDHKEAHPGHRYFTPQPDRKKPILPLKPGSRRIRVSFSEFLDVETEERNSPPLETDIDTGGVSNRENDAVPNGHASAADQDSASTRRKPRLPALQTGNTMEPLKPRRKAPSRPPLDRRRKSDTHVLVIEQLKKQQRSLSTEDLFGGASSIKRGKGAKMVRSASNACDLSTSSDRERIKSTLPHFFTPQPTRRKFNLATAVRTPSFNDFPLGPVERLALKNKRMTSQSSADSGHSAESPSSPPSPHTPLSHLVSPAFKSKKLASQKSSDSGLSPDLSSSPSPHTPVSPLAAPVFSGRARQSVRPAPPVPDSQLKSVDFNQWIWKSPDTEKQWTKPERSHHASKDIVRNRPISMPDKIRRVSRGNVNKSKQRQSAVRQVAARQQTAVRPPASPAISRINSGRHRHQSAPAGRVAFALMHNPTVPVMGPTGEEAPLSSTISAMSNMRRRDTSDSLRKEVLRSMSMERSRKMSLQSEERSINSFNERLKEDMTPLGMVDNKLKMEVIQKKCGVDEPDSGRLSHNDGSKSSLKRMVSGNGSTYSDYPSTFSASPTSSPVRQRPKFRRAQSSRTSNSSLSRSMLASKEVLNDIFMSDRYSHRKLKGVVGFLTGLVLGGFLFLALLYGLEYSLNASIVISSVGTLLMCLSLTFTVRARCVASLMVPVLCTSKGRAAFLAIIIALLLSGPIDNIYHNANVASESMSCSAELAQNQTKLIKQAADEVFNVYIANVLKSIRKLQEAVTVVHEAFMPIEDAFGGLTDALGNAGEAIVKAADACDQIIQGAYDECTGSIDQVYNECKKALAGKNLGSVPIDEICKVLKFGDSICGLLSNTGGICKAPAFLDEVISRAVKAAQAALDDIHKTFDIDVDLSAYWEHRANQTQSFDSIQEAITQELHDSVTFLNSAFSVIDKIIALSILFLLFRSYQYHSKYRTKDRFDNFYVTSEFKRLDEKRRESGRAPLLPLKKSERRRLIDLTSVWLSKPEKGLFRLGLVTVLLHAVIAAVLILADYGLFWLLSLIARHGKLKYTVSGGGGTDFSIGGSGILSDLFRSFFSEGFNAVNAFNITLNTELCLPEPMTPNNTLSIAIGVLYLIALLMVLFQAYALRLRRRIASYFYPERELERILFLYNSTLQRRSSIFKFLKERIKQSKHEMDTERRISFTAYLSAKYPFWKKVFQLLGKEKRICLGCADVDDGTFKSCGNPDCQGLYCRECLNEIGNTCTLCNEIVLWSDLSIGVVEHRV